MLGLLVHWLELSDSSEVIDGFFVSLSRLKGEASPQESLDEHVNVFDVKTPVDYLGAELNDFAILLVLAIAESDVSVDCCLLLGDFLLEDSKVLQGYF